MLKNYEKICRNGNENIKSIRKLLNSYKKYFCLISNAQMQTINFPKVSLIQRPGDSYIRDVTLIPGEGIGRELASKIVLLYIILNYHRIPIESK